MQTLAVTIPGGAEWLIILFIFVLLFGAKKLPDLARGVGQSLRIFRAETKALNDESDEATTSEQAAEPRQHVVHRRRLALQPHVDPQGAAFRDQTRVLKQDPASVRLQICFIAVWSAGSPRKTSQELECQAAMLLM
jgi:sec-independent protein translocase protein TatA